MVRAFPPHARTSRGASCPSAFIHRKLPPPPECPGCVHSRTSFGVLRESKVRARATRSQGICGNESADALRSPRARLCRFDNRRQGRMRRWGLRRPFCRLRTVEATRAGRTAEGAPPTGASSNAGPPSHKATKPKPGRRQSATSTSASSASAAAAVTARMRFATASAPHAFHGTEMNEQ